MLCGTQPSEYHHYMLQIRLVQEIQFSAVVIIVQVCFYIRYAKYLNFEFGHMAPRE